MYVSLFMYVMFMYPCYVMYGCMNVMYVCTLCYVCMYVAYVVLCMVLRL